MAELIEAPGDPIARQFVPAEAELDHRPEESADPVGDDVHSPVEGVVHRYPDRCLLKINYTCAVYCRFCFRREMVGPEGLRPLSPKALDAAMAYVADHPDIWEVIVTGGDPFILSARRLRDVMARLAKIDHVKIVRFHTRVPAVAPEMVTDELVAALQAPGKTVYVALHANHARELTPQARAACARIVDAGVPILGQTVLLKGVNDDPETLTALMRAMVETRIKPYYLHHMDHAPGTSHLRTSIEDGQALMRAMRGAVSGLCQPTYILDIPGGHGKVPVGPDYLAELGPRHRPGGPHPHLSARGELMAWTGRYDEAEPQRVNKWLGQSGVCSRREAEGMIEQGLIFIDGEKVTDTGRKILPGQTLVLLDGGAEPLSVVLHKPMGIVSAQPEQGQTPAVRLLTKAALVGESPQIPDRDTRLAPLGRLDMDSRGLLILSDDGVLAKAIIGPESDLEKEYVVTVTGKITPEKIARLCHGLTMDGRQLKPAKVSVIQGQQLRFILKEGRNRQIRRMSELVGLHVMDLVRIRIGTLRLGDLEEGRWRVLGDHERAMLINP